MQHLLCRTYFSPCIVLVLRIFSMMIPVGRNQSDDVTSASLNLSFAGSTSYQDDVMDSDASSARPPTYAGGGEATVSSFITFIILLAGVVGGLIIVVVVLIVCKYCIKGKKHNRRSLRDGSRDGGRAVRVLQRYETINSDVFSEPSSASMDGIPLSPRKPLDIRNRGRREESEEVNERTQLRSSYDRDHVYEHQPEDGFVTLDGTVAGSPVSRKSGTGDHVTSNDGAAEDSEEVEGRGRSPGNQQEGGGGGGGGSSRRVSFQLDDKFSRQHSQGSRNSRRYTEGDFHYLKYAKITALPRQFSLGTAPSSAPARPMPLLGSTASDTAFRYSLDERLRILQQDTEKSFPPIQADSSRPSSSQSQGQNQTQSQGRSSVSPDRSPRTAARTGSRCSSQDGTLTVSSIAGYDHGGVVGASGGVSRMRLSPSPPRNQRGDRWRRTPSASPSPPGEPVHRQVNVEVHFQQEDDVQEITSTAIHETTPQHYVPTHESAKQHGLPTHDTKKQYTVPLHDIKKQYSVPLHDIKKQYSVPLHDSTARSSHSISTSDIPKQQRAPTHKELTKQHSMLMHELAKQQSVPLHVQRTQAYQKKASSHSLELVGSRRRPLPTRKVKSYEDVADYDVLQITEFSRGPFYNTDFDVISEMASPTSSKVRYNDTGSLEELQEETPGELSCLALEALLPPEESDETSTLNGCHLNREIWHLRATLEEEEECSDTIRMEDMTSPDDSPDREHMQNTSFESTAQSDACASDQRDSGIQWEGRVQGELVGQREAHPAVAQARRPYPQPPLGSGGDAGGGGGPSGVPAQLLHPNYENRRQSYRNLLSGRLAKSPSGPGVVAAVLGPASAENSFDSVETDGDVSDTSRHEVTTTSFESTTDNTDSTTESQHSRLIQMKADSGYKSLETQQSGAREAGEMHEAIGLVEEPPRERLEQWREAGGAHHNGRRNGNGHYVGDGGEGHSGNGGNHGNGGGGRAEVTGGRRNSNAVLFERRAGRTASKKRREYSRERQIIHVSGSLHEPETDSRSDLHSGDSFDDVGHRRHSHGSNHQQQQHQHQHAGQHQYSAPHAPTSKRSYFTRFFSHGHSRDNSVKYMVRDYSIDEKTNDIFNEFLRQEVPTEAGGSGNGGGGGAGRLGLRRSPRSQHRPRLQRKHTEPLYRLDDRRRDRLAPEMRSASLGSDSSASSVRRLSPQDSIEEEYEEEGETEMNWKRTELAPMLEVGDSDVTEGETKSALFGAKAIPDIPIIKLPEEEVQDAS